jgi:streptomycin 6-kinase
MIQYSDDFKQTILGTFGDAGAAWLADLPALYQRIEDRWQIRIGAPFSLSYNYVARATGADGTEYVVKLGVPCPWLQNEILALRMCDGQGMVRLIDADLESGAMLEERLIPGLELAQIQEDDFRTRVIAAMMGAIWRPLPEDHPFPTLDRWTVSLRHYADERLTDGPLPARLMDRAAGMLAELLAFSGPVQLLHGDLHHYNVLSRVDHPTDAVAAANADVAADWCAIDPKGVAGEPEFEVGAMLMNPFDGIPARAEIRRIASRRIDLLAEQLSLDRQKLLRWGAVCAALSAAWSVEDHTDWELAAAFGEELMTLISP